MGDYGYQGTTRPLSPLEFYPNRGSRPTSLFSSNNNNDNTESSATIMQDEILAEKLAVKQSLQQQLQQLSPSVEVNSDNSDISPKSKSEELNSATVPEKDFKQEITQSIDSTTASTLQQQLVSFQQEPISTLATSSSVGLANNGVSPAFWSSAITDETHLQNLHTLNGAVQFPNYTLSASMFSPTLAPQLNMQKQQPQQHRHSLPPQPTQQAFFPTASQLQQVQIQQAQIQQLQAQVAGSLFIPQKQYNWSNPQQQSRWSTASGQTLHQQHNNPWSAANSSNIHSQNATNALNRRSMPSLMNSQLGPLSPTKGRASNPIISPPKFQRSSSVPGKSHHTSMNSHMSIPGSGGYQKRNGDINTNTLFPYHGQERQLTNPLGDPMKLSSLEHQLLDIMKGTDQPLDPFGRGPWSSPLFNTDGLLDDGQHDQVVPSLTSPSRMSPRDYGERFSRKVFVGGLPPDIDEEEITASFRRFGPLVVDWPHKAESKSYFPPKGYAFLLFQDERSVQALIDACIKEGDKLYLCVSSPTIKDKPVQIRPWNLGDSDFVLDGTQPLDPRKTIFVGGVPRPLRALELAMIMDRLYGGVCYAGIDTDPELKYPKGAGRVAFANQQSYIAAISARFVQLQHGDIDKRVEVKPYVLDDQMCDECQGTRCAGKFAPFFCANVTCLQYYCEICWATIHSRPGREFHKPLVKEGSDRPRTMPFRW
ncbi:cytoplasmic polyadenylation element-binding protein 2-like [Anneissia japonica]|uniref:cytoplasmic polyadenylation element-binding protein 2-like n=1 Tax=Anneissia japonica TaxID=1529436 RepID=UPI0014257713|nr:cytoplasmic polyadenylation element-binding protein 2-like [Anneissia japonica]